MFDFTGKSQSDKNQLSKFERQNIDNIFPRTGFKSWLIPKTLSKRLSMPGPGLTFKIKKCNCSVTFNDKIREITRGWVQKLN